MWSFALATLERDSKAMSQSDVMLCAPTVSSSREYDTPSGGGGGELIR